MAQALLNITPLPKMTNLLISFQLFQSYCAMYLAVKQTSVTIYKMSTISIFLYELAACLSLQSNL